MNILLDEKSVAQILSDAITANPNLNRMDIARKIGLAHPNNISLFKTGKTKIPLERAARLAEAVGINPSDFWFKCLKEYKPGQFKAYESITQQPVLSSDEVEFIVLARAKNIAL